MLYLSERAKSGGYDNDKRKKSYVKPGQTVKLTTKLNIHDPKVMLYICWDQ